MLLRESIEIKIFFPCIFAPYLNALMSQIPYIGAKWAAKGERCSLVHWPGSLPLGLSQTAVRKTRRGIGVILQLIARCSFQTHPEQLLHGLLHFLKPFFTSLFSQLGNFWCSLFKKILHLALQEKKRSFEAVKGRSVCLGVQKPTIGIYESRATRV